MKRDNVFFGSFLFTSIYIECFVFIPYHILCLATVNDGRLYCESDPKILTNGGLWSKFLARFSRSMRFYGLVKNSKFLVKTVFDNVICIKLIKVYIQLYSGQVYELCFECKLISHPWIYPKPKKNKGYGILNCNTVLI